MAKYVYIFMCLVLLFIGGCLLVFEKVVGGNYSTRYGGMEHGTISGYPLILISIIMLIPGLTALLPKKVKPEKNIRKTKK